MVMVLCMVNIHSCRTQIYFKESFLSNEGMQEAWGVKIQKCKDTKVVHDINIL